ncbi:MAG: hypothetical protein L6416_00950 [Candidatus Omnitrophica bacterium]|nr:hypothetical protein [Candidatus Omnitrophota bacterium]
MKNRLKKNDVSEDVWEEDVFDSYLSEMNELVNRYPDDPNKIDLSERKLYELIQELDDNWMAFRKKWKNKLKDAEKVFGTGTINKDKNGMRHLVIKSDFSGQDIMDIFVSEKKKQK